MSLNYIPSPVKSPTELGNTLDFNVYVVSKQTKKDCLGEKVIVKNFMQCFYNILSPDGIALAYFTDALVVEFR